MKKLQAQYLEELLDQAYQQIGDVPLTDEQESTLITTCIEQVEQASYPQAKSKGTSDEKAG